MPTEEIRRTIYQLDIDEAGFIKAVDSMSASLKKLTEVQNSANNTLKTNQEALKKSSDFVQQTKKDLDSYTGSNEQYRKQLEKSYADAVSDQKALGDLVKSNQQAYEKATQAAENFAQASRTASGGNIPVPGNVVTSVPVVNPVVPDIKQAFDTATVNDFNNVLSNTSDEFDQLRSAIGLAEERMSHLNESDAEFQQLSQIVAQGKSVLEQYGNATQNVTTKQISLRQEILNGNAALARLEETGQGNTEQYAEMEKHVAHLTELYREQRERVRVLSSETRALDFGKGAIESAISGFEVYNSIAILAGGASEELQKKTLQLFAAMQLLTGLERLAEQVKRGGIISTNLQSAAQATYTAVVGASTGALKAFRLALLGTGIGAAVVAIGFLVERYNDYIEKEKEADVATKNLADINAKAAESVGRVQSKITELTVEIGEAKKGFLDKNEVLKQYNESLGKTLGATNSLDEAERKLIEHGPDLIQLTFLKAQAQAAGELAAEEAKKSIKAQTEGLNDVLDFGDKVKANLKGIFSGFFGGQQDQLQNTVDAASKTADKNRADEEKKSKSQFDRLTQLQQKFLTDAIEFAKTHKINFFETSTGGSSKGTPENVFEQEKANLLAKLAELRTSEQNSIQKINDEFAAKLQQEQTRIEGLLKSKKVTKDQEKILLDIAVEVNKEGLDKALSDFNKKVTDARQKLTDQLRTLQEKETLDELNLIQNDFDRRAKLIDFNEQKELADAKAATDERLRSLDLDRALIGEQAYQEDRQRIISLGEQQVNNIVRKAAQERQNLSADIFQKSLENYQKAIIAGDLVRDEGLADELKKQADRFLTGQVSFEHFQRSVTEIQRRYESQRRDGEIQVLEDELTDINLHLAAIKDANSKEYTDTVETQKRIRDQIAKLKATDAQADVKDQNDESTQRAATVQRYAEAVGNLAESVIKFWQTANEAEQRALERSINIQQTRVTEAQRIADRGNATYLKAETDRLKELQVARENAARKQLGIDAALQGSQILVAITGAISKIATPGIGVAETISEIAIIVGALATGYALVKSLRANQPQLREGTTYVERGRNPSGVDTIPAWLNEGEAVIPQGKNREYKKSVEAIYHGRVPAGVMNDFVENYVKKGVVVNHDIKPVVQVNHERIRQANEAHISHDTRMAEVLREQNNLLRENNELQRQAIQTFKKSGVSVHYDAEGLAVVQQQHIEQSRRNKRL